MEPIPARIDLPTHATMRQLASAHDNGIGEEYRAAVRHWIARHADDLRAAA